MAGTEKTPSLINWKRGDYVRLSKAVAKFNRKISSLQPSELTYLPSMKDYQDIKKEILSRKELNRIVNALRRFDVEGAEVKVTLPSGEELTKWEYRELKLARNRAIKLRESQKEDILSGDKFRGMGSEKLSQYEKSIDYLKRIETFKGSEFKEALELTEHLGSKQYDLWIANIYRKNFMESLEQMSEYDNYELLKEKLESIENPLKFYDYIKKSQTLLDLFFYYQDKATSSTYGGFRSNQDAFNRALVDLGVITESELEKKQNEALEQYGAVLSEFYRRF